MACMLSRWATSQIWNLRWVLPSTEPQPHRDSSSAKAKTSAVMRGIFFINTTPLLHFLAAAAQGQRL